MGNSLILYFRDPRATGWTAPDRFWWWFVQLFFEGTSRGLLQVLFGAGALILLSKTLARDGLLEAADLYYRRNLWLMLFGILNATVLLWFGDILLPYAVSALFLFPFRRLSGKALLSLVLLYLGVVTAFGIGSYRQELAVQTAVQAQAAHRPLDAAALAAVSVHETQLTRLHPSPAALTEERAIRLGSPAVEARWSIALWWTHEVPAQLLDYPLTEYLFIMILGMALYKFGITQGQRSAGFYLAFALLAYTSGLSVRVLDIRQVAMSQALPHIGTAFGEFARLAVTLGHLALINMLMRLRPGRVLLAPFKAAGRMAFSLYLMQSVLCMWILFPRFGFGLWGHYGPFGLTMIALAVTAGQLILANL